MKYYRSLYKYFLLYLVGLLVLLSFICLPYCSPFPAAFSSEQLDGEGLSIYIELEAAALAALPLPLSQQTLAADRAREYAW